MRRWLRVLTALAVAVTAGCAQSGAASNGAPRRGGHLVIDRIADSESMDNTSVFDNESIWVFEQMLEPLYTVTRDGKSVQPWLATSYDLTGDKRTYTFHLRHGVRFSTGREMTSADVKFSLDQARAAKDGWGYIDAAMARIDAADRYTVVVHTKYPWAPMLADIAMFSNGIVPKDYDGQSKQRFYQHPYGTGPFTWDHWTLGQELTLKRNPYYWQPGKPYLDKVTWRNVPDDNTRQLQLAGEQADIDEFPPFATVDPLRHTPGVRMTLFPSTRTDYLIMNSKRRPLDDVHVRRAISYAIDRRAMVHAVLFGDGAPANSFMPPQVPYYDPRAPGLQYDLAQAKREMATSSAPHGFTMTLLTDSGDNLVLAIAQIAQESLAKIGIAVRLKLLDPNAVRSTYEALDYDMAHTYWTMDIADPDELVTFAVDPGAGSHAFYTQYQNAAVIAETKAAEATFSGNRRKDLYREIQQQTAQDAFVVSLFYSPYAYATRTSVHGFYVYPTGNYHLEDVRLSR